VIPRQVNAAEPARFRAALSVHPVAAAATGEAIGDVLDALGTRPDVAIVVATGAHQASLEQITAAVSHTLSPTVVLACGSHEALAGQTTAAASGAVLIWAARELTATPWSLREPQPGPQPGPSVRRESHPQGPAAVAELPHTGTLVVLANEPGTFGRIHSLLGSHRPDLMVVGGLLPSGSRLGIGTRDTNMDPGSGIGPRAGAVGFIVGADTNGTASTGVASGPLVRPIGNPVTVTATDKLSPAGDDAGGTLLTGLAGRPALDEVDRVLASLSPDDRELAADHIALGRVVNHGATDFTTSDLEALRVRGVATGRRAVAIGADVAVGSVVQFVLPDPAHAAATVAQAAAAPIAHPAPGMLLLCTDLASLTPPAGAPSGAATDSTLGTADAVVAGLGCLAVVGGPAGQSVVHTPGIVALALG
jgi:small ligand-binding sensory domain FIST